MKFWYFRQYTQQTIHGAMSDLDDVPPFIIWFRRLALFDCCLKEPSELIKLRKREKDIEMPFPC